MTDSFFKQALADPYLMQVPSQRPETLPTPGVSVGKPTSAAPLHAAVVSKLRKSYPGLEDLGDDELLSGVHKVMVEDKTIPENSTVDDMMKHLSRAGTVIKIGSPGKVSNEQMSVPVLPTNEVPSERVWPDLVKKNWPELSDLDASEVLRGMYKEQRKNGKLDKAATFDQFLTSLVGSGDAEAKGVPGASLRSLALGLTEPFVAPVEAAGHLLAAGTLQTPEAQAMRNLASEEAGRGAGAFVSLLPGAATHIADTYKGPLSGIVVPAIKTARDLIGEQMANGAKAIGIYNALTSTGEVAPAAAAGDMSVVDALKRIGISTAIGAASGAVLEPVLGAGAHLDRIATNNKAAIAIAQKEVQNLQQKAIQVFINDFKPEWIGTRFHDAFDPALPDDQIARNIVASLGSSAPEAAPQEMVDAIAQKVGQYRALEEKNAAGLGSRVFPEMGDTITPAPVTPAPAPEGLETSPLLQSPLNDVTQVSQPVGAPLETTQGGIAPEPNAVPMDATGFTPPGSVKPAAGLQSMPAPTAAPAPPPEPIVMDRQPMAPVEPISPPSGLVDTQEANAATPRGSLPPSIQGPIAPAENQPSAPPRGVKLTPGFERVPKPETAPEIRVAKAADEIRALGQPTGAPDTRFIGDVEYRISHSGDSRAITLDYIRNTGKEKGAGMKVLAQIIEKADQSGVPIELKAEPLSQPNGSRIPLGKLVAFYKKLKFKVVERSEGFVTMRRDPKKG